MRVEGGGVGARVWGGGGGRIRGHSAVQTQAMFSATADYRQHS